MRVVFIAGDSVTSAPEWLRLLQSECPGVEVVDSFSPESSTGPFDAAVVASPARGALARFPGLRLIQSCWAGVDALLQDDTLPRDVPLARMVDPAMAERIAETALWAALSLHRGFFAYAARSAAGVWQQHAQVRADEVRCLVLGYGTMGSRIAMRLAQVGYPVQAWRSKSAREGAAPLPVRCCSCGSQCSSCAGTGSVSVLHGDAALRAALPSVRVVICALPLTPATNGLINAGFLGALPRGAGIVNLGRGGHVVLDDLLPALASGHIQHAVLDVFDSEPLPRESPLWAHPQVTVLPHAAALTDPRSAVSVVAVNLHRLAAGEPLAHVVDCARGY